MPKPVPRYHSPEFPEGITRSAFRRLRREQKIEVMRSWFGQHYEDPAQRTPYESAEGGYQWIWGGPYDAREELESEFGGLAPQKLIEELVEELEQEGTKWAPTPSDGDYDDERDDRDEYVPDADEEWPPVVVDQRPEVDPLDAIANKIEFGLIPKYGSREELAARDVILKDIKKVEEELDRLNKPSSMMGHNNPPEPIEAEATEATVVTEDDEKRKIKAVVADIRTEIKSDAPDVTNVVTSTRHLRDSLIAVLKWSGKKIDTGIDEFIKSVMKTLGISATPFILAKAIGHYDALIGAIGSLYLNLLHWLQLMMSIQL
ncbi:hypothetical protein VH569_13345 [Azospirillum sp. 11R-A]|uniref:hypothetical protein n=1 Tax=Azospirillum sp. 11R-A TaxID=3111634 RepID=UPI003C17F7ED